MKLVYQYIVFMETKNEYDEIEWECQNKKSAAKLGVVGWYRAWNQFCYFPTCPATYSGGCLDDISSFIALRQDEPIPSDQAWVDSANARANQSQEAG